MEKIKVKAFFLGERANLKQIEEKTLALYPMVIKTDDNGYAVIFRYGATVLFNISEEKEQEIITKISKVVSNPHKKPVTETSYIIVNQEVKSEMMDENGNIILSKFPTLVEMQVIAIVLAENVALSLFEQNATELFDRLDPLILAMKEKGGDVKTHETNLLKSIGGVLKVMLNMVARVGTMDNPDVLWDNPKYERLFKALKDEYEVFDRDKSLNKKFSLASDTVETLLDLTRHSHSAKLDWYVIILIIISVSVMAYELMHKFIAP